MFSKLTQALRTESTSGSDIPGNSRSIDDLSGDETQAAIDFLEFLGRDTTASNIEWAAAQLEAGDIDLLSPLETHGDRRAADRQLLAPDIVEDRPMSHVRDDKAVQILTVTSFPRQVGLGWLVPLTLADVDHRISMHVQPRDDSSALQQLQKRYTQVTTNLARKRRLGHSDTFEGEQQRQDLQRLLKKAIKGTTTLYDVAIYIELIADAEDDLQMMRNRVETILAEQDVDVAPIQYQQLDGMSAVAPTCSDPIDNTHPIQAEALAMCFNMVEPAIYDPSGVCLGFDDSKRPVILDRYDLSGHSMIISGKKGSGKTYFRKKELYGRLRSDRDIQAIIFDPAGDDYLKFAQDLGGQVIHFGRNHTVNPMAISPPTEEEIRAGDDPYVLTTRSVIEMLRTYFERRDGLDAGEEGLVTQATHYAYLANGIFLGVYDTYGNQSPIFDDLFRGIDIVAAGGLDAAADQGLVDDDEHELFRTLVERSQVNAAGTGAGARTGNARDTGAFEFGPTATASPSNESGEGKAASPADSPGSAGPETLDDITPEQAERLPLPRAILDPSEHHQRLAEQLQPKFESFKPGGINYNLNGRTSIDLDSRVVAMDISAFADPDEMPLFLHAMLSWAYETAKRSPHKIDVTFDEAHYLLKRAAARELINLYIRHARHFDAGLTLMSQTAHEFIKTDDRREVYENCDVKAMFYAESVSEQMRDYHSFADSEVEFIQGAARGESAGFSECLLSSSEHGRRRLEVRSGPFEHAVLDDDHDPWQWLAENEDLAVDPATPGDAPGVSNLDQTDLPDVMASDLDIELAMEMGRDHRGATGGQADGTDGQSAPRSQTTSAPQQPGTDTTRSTSEATDSDGTARRGGQGTPPGGV